MSNLLAAIWGELLKARRSKMPLFTLLGNSLVPLAGGFFMIILRDPELARRSGLISAKAQITMGTADWQSYLGLLAMATATGGIVLFGMVGIWVFGREFSDHTVTDMLALPTPRSSIVLAKFIVVALWSLALTVSIFLIGLGVGAAVQLEAVPDQVFVAAALNIGVTALLTIALTTPFVFVAGAGRGYLPPMGVVLLALIAAQIVATAGWGEFFPWSVPALSSGAAGPEYQNLGAISFVLVAVTSLAGLVATFVWWEYADQTA
jgi:ABC-2 type transport system permease protein